MELFHISGNIGRRDYAEVWAATSLLALLYLAAFWSGWLRPLSIDGSAFSIEELPGLAGVLVPLLACIWCLFAAGLRRCRDADFPLWIYLGLIALLLMLPVIQLSLPYSLRALAKVLKALSTFDMALLLMLCAALAVVETLSLTEPPSFRAMHRKDPAAPDMPPRTPRFGRRT